MELNFPLISLVVILSIVQSFFGVGLLLFGTPLLLAMGYPFVEVLIYLLPCSITINLLQLLFNRSVKLEFTKPFLLILCPSVGAGLVISLIMEKAINLRLLIAFMLLLSGTIRIFPIYRARVERMARRFSRPYLSVTGLLHGLTNMGGGFLTLFTGSCFRDKASIRIHTALGYSLMATCQLLLLLVTKPSLFSETIFFLPAVSALVFLIIGNRFFYYAAEAVYEKCITVLIFFFGILLLL